MRRTRVLGSVVGLVVLGSACATTTGRSGVSAFSAAPTVKRMSRTEQVAWRDSVYAQAIADIEGPGASIRAEFSSFAGSRRVRGVFSLDADAYVVIGHIDGTGVLRIAFPGNPASDDGFVKGGKSYQTQEFFAGFNEEIRFRAATQYRPVTRNYDSYDGGVGFMFIIASWRPMHFDRFREGDTWDSFELTDDSYLRDPRPAIYELATLLVGENREAYTVKFARYTNTTTPYAGLPFGGMGGFGSFGFCSGFGYRPLGFAFDPMADGFLNMMLFGMMGANMNRDFVFSRRGVNYYFDSFRGCYRTLGPTLRLFPTTRIASGPVEPPGVGNGGTVTRAFDLDGGARTPFNPRLPGASTAPGGRVVDGDARGNLPAPSPTYRERGLITTDNQVGSGSPGRREPRVASREASERARPSIQDMVGRRPATSEYGSRASNGGGYTRGSYRASGSSGSGSSYGRPTARDRGNFDAGRYSGGAASGGGGGGGGVYSGGSPVGATSGGTGGSSATVSSPPASGAGSGPTGSSSGSRPPL